MSRTSVVHRHHHSVLSLPQLLDKNLHDTGQLPARRPAPRLPLIPTAYLEIGLTMKTAFGET